MNEDFTFIDFVANIAEVIYDKKVRKLRKCDRLEEYLRILRLKSILELYDNCVEDAPALERRKLAESDIDIPKIIANEIVRRYLTGLPKKENLNGLESFLQRYSPDDSLLNSINDLCSCVNEAENWFEEEQTFLSKLKEISSTDTQFRSAITRVLLAFQLQDIQDIYFTNIIVTVRKEEHSTENPERDKLVSRFIQEHTVDGLIRRVCTYGTETDKQIFPLEACAKPEFDTVARRAQEHLRATRKVPGDAKLIQYAFMDRLAYHSELEHEGSSAGLAFARLAYAYHKSLDNRLAPYIAWCGSLTGADTVERVSNIAIKVRIARENGIRVVVLSEDNKAELEQIDGMEFITYPEGKLSDVTDCTKREVDELHIRFLCPKEVIYWNEFIEKSKMQHKPILQRAKRKAKYDLNKYVRRGEPEVDFESFLQDFDTNCMAIVGGSGTGKTYLLCNLCDKSIHDGNIVLFFDGMSLSSDNVLMDNVLSLKPSELDVSCAEFIGIVNSTAEWKGNYFMISLDAINEAEIGAEKALRAIEHLLAELGRAPSSDRVRIFLTCRSETWKRILYTHNLTLSEEKYYGTLGNGKYVPLDLFTVDERDNALNIRFGDQAKNLSSGSKEMLRDPFLIRLAEEVYGDSRLPADIISWKLINEYYQKFIPDVLGDHRLRLIDLLVDEMLSQGTDRISRYNSGNTELDNLHGSEAFDRLVDDGVLSREGEYVRFPHERFTEIHLAKALIHQSGDRFSQELVIDYLEKTLRFPLLWGGLKIACMKEWDEQLLVDISTSDDQKVAEFAVDVLTAIGREDRGKINLFLKSKLMKSKSDNAKRVAIYTAYNLGDTEVLKAGVLDRSELTRTIATQHAHYFWQHNRDEGFRMYADICSKASLTNRRAIEAGLSLGFFTYADNWQDPEFSSKINTICKDNLERLLGVKEGDSGMAKLMKDSARKTLFSVAISFTSRTMRKITEYNNINIPEMDEFFKLPESEKQKLTRMARYGTQERNDIEPTIGEILELAMQKNAFSTILCSFVPVLQSVRNMQTAIQVIQQGFEHPDPYVIDVVASVPAYRILLHQEAVDEHLLDIYGEGLRRIIHKYRGRHDSNIGTYWMLAPSAYAAAHTKLHEVVEIPLITELMDFAKETANEDAGQLLAYMIESVGYFLGAYWGYHGTALRMLEPLTIEFLQNDVWDDSIRKKAVDAIVRGLVGIRIYHPDDVYTFLERTHVPTYFKEQVKRAATKETFGDLITAKSDSYFSQIVLYSPSIRREFFHALAAVADCRNTADWIKHIAREVVRVVCGEDILG